MAESPITRFLGEVDRRNGPFGLLGLSPEQCEPGDVDRALHARLTRVASHPHASSPEADEVRLALHVAAAQLRDARVRRELIEQHRTLGDSAPRSNAEQVASADFRDAALRVIVHSGGWNERSKRRLAALAHVYGLDAPQFERALRDVGGGRRNAGQASRRRGEGVASERKSYADESRRRRRIHTLITAAPTVGQRVTLITLMCVLALSCILMVGRLATLWNANAPTGATEGDDTTVADADADASRPSETSPPTVTDSAESNAPKDDAPQAPPPRTPEQLTAIFDDLVNAAPSDPDAAITDFADAVADLAITWTGIDSARLLALHGELVRVTHALWAASQDGEAIAAAVAGDGGLGSPVTDASIRRSVWTRGMLNRLRRDRNLPIRLADAIDNRAARFGAAPSGAGFMAGAEQALMEMTSRLVAPEENADDPRVVLWGSWIAALRAIPELAPAQRDRHTLEAIERLLIQGEDPALHGPTRESLALLLNEVEWSVATPAGETLVRWFDRSEIAASDLTEITNWLAARGAATVEPDMTATTDMSPEERLVLRNRYASVWGLATLERDEDIATRWARESREAIVTPPANVARGVYLDSALRAARLNEAAAHMYRQNDNLAASAMDRAAAGLQSPPGSASSGGSGSTPSGGSFTNAIAVPGLTATATGEDGQWALRYLAGGRGPAAKLVALDTFPTDTAAIGPADGDVLAIAACFGPSLEVRVRAQRLVMRHGASSAVVNGLLEISERMPSRRRISEMIEGVTGRRLPYADAPEWRLEARRAIVETLLAQLASDVGGDTDAYAAAIGAAYAARAFGVAPSVEADASAPDSMAASSTTLSVQDVMDNPALGAAELADAWRAAASRFIAGEWAFTTLDAIDRRREGRSRFARGPVQHFVAEQVSAAEYMAWVVAANRPSQSERVRAIIDRMDEERRPKRSSLGREEVFRQIDATERAMLQLWMVLLGEPLEEA